MSKRTIPDDSEKTADQGMQRWHALLLQVGDKTDNALDRLRHSFNRRFRPNEPLQIIPYQGFANDKTAYFMGRVIEYRKPPSSDVDSLWSTLLTSYQRFETDEVPGVTVRACHNGHCLETVTDAEGYYRFEMEVDTSASDTEIEIEINLPAEANRSHGVISRVTCPRADADFGVISDIDDTVLLTNATSLLEMMRLTLLQSSKSRVAFAGVVPFYRALHAGKNPFFYVSSSPWNLYEFLYDFMETKGIARRPLLLRDFGIDRTKFIAGPHKVHKLAQIKSVMDSLPHLKFILVGDSGQHDPEIYSQCVKDYPGRILAIYIRNVSTDDQSVLNQRIESLQVDGVPLLLVANTLDAAKHAAESGYIAADSLAGIREVRNLDVVTESNSNGNTVV